MVFEEKYGSLSGCERVSERVDDDDDDGWQVLPTYSLLLATASLPVLPHAPQQPLHAPRVRRAVVLLLLHQLGTPFAHLEPHPAPPLRRAAVRTPHWRLDALCSSPLPTIEHFLAIGLLLPVRFPCLECGLHGLFFETAREQIGVEPLRVRALDSGLRPLPCLSRLHLFGTGAEVLDAESGSLLQQRVLVGWWIALGGHALQVQLQLRERFALCGVGAAS